MGNTKLVDAWEITPHRSSHFDSCIIKENGDGGKEAIDYAKSVIEEKWDEVETLEGFDLTVRIRRIKIDPEDIPEED